MVTDDDISGDQRGLLAAEGWNKEQPTVKSASQPSLNLERPVPFPRIGVRHQTNLVFVEWQHGKESLHEVKVFSKQ
ncbi:hypothetical protein GCM10009765_63500 [Fodinicola feengrottensis]|uniref:Uncharacterized protein n=1 Tax=Fodinicola feengrottensis TaxID=435914 RepID=A0ABP4UIX0_9ACTN